MESMRLSMLVVALWFAAPLCASLPVSSLGQEAPPDDVKVMAWNILHGGREDGDEVGPQRVIDVIRESGADIVAMQETYGSGELISKALGFHFQPRGTNVSIHSRFPVLEDLSVHKEFECVGALIELPDAERVAFYSIWLPYSREIWEEGTRDTSKPADMLAACEASRASLTAIRDAIDERLSAPEYEGVTVMIAGDFNSMSHLDYGEVGVDQYGVALDWPTGRILPSAGYRDAYREVTPVIDRAADATWSPRFPKQEQDRIDFVYYRSSRWRAKASSVIRTHPDGFPSDHAALVATMSRAGVKPAPKPQIRDALRVATYNIKHGVGMDGKLDLARTTAALARLDADVIALQEVDLGVKRSGGRNQVMDLARALDMHPAFGSFMPYQGGQYGLALLSRLPIVSATSLRLTNGNEPRVALVCDLRAPSGRVFQAVNVHFDWVADDGFRVAQAKEVVGHLESAGRPFLVLGDFNDVPESRTMALFQSVATNAAKDAGARLTIPADKPAKEIDYIYASTGDDWTLGAARSVSEAVASDHRPVLVELTLSGR